MSSSITRAALNIFGALCLVLGATQAFAIPTLRRVDAAFSDGGNGTVLAGLVIEATSSLPVLGVGGGFTIRCSTSTLLLTAERFQTVTNFIGTHLVVSVPPAAPSSYSVPRWSSIPAGSCSAQCTMQYNGEARDESNMQMTIGGVGSGVTFTLIPDGQTSMGNTRLINICRGGRPQCCTPGCVLP
jgi:hypothetical protein